MTKKELFFEFWYYVKSLHPKLRLEIDTSYYELSQLPPISNGSCTSDGYIMIYMDVKNPNWEEALFVLMHEVGHWSEWGTMRNTSGSSPYQIEYWAWYDGLILFLKSVKSGLTADETLDKLLGRYLDFAEICLKSYIT